jgi:hypothetical protein
MKQIPKMIVYWKKSSMFGFSRKSFEGKFEPSSGSAGASPSQKFAPPKFSDAQDPISIGFQIYLPEKSPRWGSDSGNFRIERLALANCRGFSDILGLEFREMKSRLVRFGE